MHKYEQKFCSELNKWLTYYGRLVIGRSCPIECKVGIGSKPINIKSGFKPHQIPTLLQAKNNVHAYKVSDMDQMPKPYDIAFFCEARSLIAFHWVERGNKTFYLVDPEDIVTLQETGKKSIYEADVMLVCFYKGEFK